MNLDYFRLLYGYNSWANHHLLDLAGRLTPEQLHAPHDGAYGSVHTTLVHMLDVEWSWLDERWRGNPIGRTFDPADYPDVATIRSHWATVEAELNGFVDSLTESGESSPDRILVWEGDGGAIRRRPLWQLLFHLLNHGTQHRSEIAIQLTTFGYSPGDMDLTRYLNLRDAGEAT